MVLIFPGQGSQAPGMGRWAFDNFSEFRLCFEEGSEALGLDLKKLCFESSVEELSKTHNTQPAILAVSVALFRSLKKEMNLKAQFTAGHSIGEYGALVASESIDFTPALRAVRLRGQYMQEAVPLGSGGMMACLGLSWGQLEKVCGEVSKVNPKEVVAPANNNSPGQIVVAGTTAGLEALRNFNLESVLGPGAKCKWIPLQVSAPFHSSLMRPAQQKMESVLNEMTFSKAKIPVVQNLDAKPHSESSQLKSNLLLQISAPVKWLETMTFFQEQGVSQAVEVGHGKVLAGLAKKLEGAPLQVMGLNSLEDFRALTKN